MIVLRPAAILSVCRVHWLGPGLCCGGRHALDGEGRQMVYCYKPRLNNALQFRNIDKSDRSSRVKQCTGGKVS